MNSVTVDEWINKDCRVHSDKYPVCYKIKIFDKQRRVNAPKTNQKALLPFRKAAFTLAEVLITLGIIGIVAAITLPAVIQSYQKRETVSRLKKSYSSIQQAIRMSEVENGSLEHWQTNLNGHDFFVKYLQKYFIEPKEISSSQAISIAPHYYLNGQKYAGCIYSGKCNRTTNFLLSDGTMITAYYDGTMYIAVDVNGYKKPNTIGKDSFVFFFHPQKGLLPDGKPGAALYSVCGENCTRERLMTYSNYSCNKSQNGRWCTYLIMIDGWEIKNDYPW
jgi:prepilin-type N-terminal cleavage/methylation domain-containing protein